MIRALCYFIFTCVCLFSLGGCANDSEEMYVTMKDGFIIKVRPDVKHYASQYDFEHAVSFDFPMIYDYNSVEEISYAPNERGVVYGADQTFIGCWELASFGDWIRDLGLEPGKVYYTATKVYVKYLKAQQPTDDVYISPDPGSPYMGFIPFYEQSIFEVKKHASAGVTVLTTGVRIIGYRPDLYALNFEIPSNLTNNNQLPQWNYRILPNVWD